MSFLHLLEQIRSPFLTTVFKILTCGGEEILLMGLLCLIMWCLNKKLAYRMCFAYFVSGLTVQALKITFRIPRPWVRDISFSPVPEVLETATGYSFPSGHTQGATAFFGTIALNQRKKKLWILCLLIIAAVGMSRMYLGVHTPADVLVSFAVSSVLIVLVKLLFTEDFLKKHAIAVFAGMCVLCFGVIAYALLLNQAGTIEQHYASDCCKAAGAGLGFAAAWYLERRFIHYETKCCHLWQQGVKYLCGVIGILFFKVGMKEMVPEMLPMDCLRYFLTVFWAIAVFPALWMRLAKKWVNKTPADAVSNRE